MSQPNPIHLNSSDLTPQEEQPARRRLTPYDPIWVYLVGFVFGAAGTIVMAFVNRRRMGNQKGFWVIVLIALLIYLGPIVGLDIFFPLSFWGIIASVIFVIGVVEWQKPQYRLWLQAHGNQPPSWAENGGWLRGAVVLGSALILFVLLSQLITLLQPLIIHGDFITLSWLGCGITMLGPAIYDLLTRKPMLLNQMLLYSAGWVVSVPFSVFLVFGGMLASDGYSTTNSLRNFQLGIQVWSSITFYPVMLVALIAGWILFQLKHYRMARVFILLPLINVVLFFI